MHLEAVESRSSIRPMPLQSPKSKPFARGEKGSATITTRSLEGVIATVPRPGAAAFSPSTWPEADVRYHTSANRPTRVTFRDPDPPGLCQVEEG